MTIAELNRAIASKNRVEKLEEQKQASFDYILADLVGRSVARLYNSSNKMPSIQEAYSSLFDAEEIEKEIQHKKDELSAVRFKLFAQSFNSRIKGVCKEE